MIHFLLIAEIYIKLLFIYSPAELIQLIAEVWF